jgi:hypothetical protein
MMKARKPKRYAEGGAIYPDKSFTTYIPPDAGYRAGINPEHLYFAINSSGGSTNQSGPSLAQQASDAQAMYGSYNQGGGGGDGGGGVGGGGAVGDPGGPGGPNGPGSVNSGDVSLGDTSMNGESQDPGAPPDPGSSEPGSSGSSDADGDKKGGLVKLKKKNMAKGGFLKSMPVRKMAKGGVVKAATNFGRGDGCAARGKTKGRMV